MGECEYRERERDVDVVMCECEIFDCVIAGKRFCQPNVWCGREIYESASVSRVFSVVAPILHCFSDCAAGLFVESTWSLSKCDSLTERERTSNESRRHTNTKNQ